MNAEQQLKVLGRLLSKRNAAKLSYDKAQHELNCFIACIESKDAPIPPDRPLPEVAGLLLEVFKKFEDCRTA